MVARPTRCAVLLSYSQRSNDEEHCFPRLTLYLPLSQPLPTPSSLLQNGKCMHYAT